MSIKEQIKATLHDAGLWNPNQLSRTDYDDTVCEVSIHPMKKWADAECFIALYPDRVEKRTRSYPLNYSRSYLEDCFHYSTKEEMVSKVRSWMKPATAPCWN